ncbi:MAG: glycosyltransferase [Planctomycetes bacterium]|nr:glycosyltransferase [Planctomycetota bacterium]
MPARPEVSVVLPVRNGAVSVAAAVASVRAQTFSDWELLVVDDGSRDETAAVVSAAAQRDRRIRLLRRPPRGIAEALIFGCAAARGEFIARMDADDWMAPQRLELQSRFLKQHPQTGLVSCRVVYGGDPAVTPGYAEHVAWLNSLDTAESIALRRFVDSPVAHPSVMFRRSVMERLGGYRAGDFPEDYELWLRWHEAGVRFAKAPEELLVWNDPPTRLSRTDPRYRVEAFYQLKCEYLARWLKAEAPRRQVWLWGAGRITRLRFRGLERHGVRIAGYIDIDPAKAGRVLDGRPIVLPRDLPPREDSFILAGVGVRGARDLIVGQLLDKGWREAEDFLAAA